MGWGWRWDGVEMGLKWCKGQTAKLQQTGKVEWSANCAIERSELVAEVEKCKVKGPKAV